MWPVRVVAHALALAAAVAAWPAAHAVAQPGADLPLPPPPAPTPPPLDDLGAALATVDAGPDWSRVGGAAWRHRDGLAVSVASAPGACLGRGDADVDPIAPYFRWRASPIGQLDWCLQRAGGVVVVSVTGLGGAGYTVEALRSLDELRARIAGALRPRLAVDGLGDLQTRLPLTPVPDGFAIDGLPAPTFVHVRAVEGTCASAAPDPALPHALLAPRGVRWAGDVRADDDDASLCLERAQDALAVSVHGTILQPEGLTPSAAALWHPELLAVLEALHDAVDRGDSPPRWFGASSHRVALPSTGVDLRGTTLLGDGWELDRTPGAPFKIVDGAAFGEPGTDVLVPRRRGRLLVGFGRGPCAAAEGTRPAPTLLPRELGGLTVDAGPSFRAHACVRTAAGPYAVLVRALDEGAPANDEDVRLAITAFAESVGVPIAGRPRRFDGAVLLAIPVVRTDGGTSHGGVAVRMRGLIQVGRPWSFLVGGELALGAAGDAYHAGEGPAPDPESDELPDLPGDLLAEARLALGGGVVVGPVTLDLMAGASAARYWPDDSWLDVGAGASWWSGRNRVRVRYTVTPLRWSQMVEVSAARPPAALMLRALDFPTDEPAHGAAGSPARALELAVGIAY